MLQQHVTENKENHFEVYTYQVSYACPLYLPLLTLFLIETPLTLADRADTHQAALLRAA